MLSRHSGTS